jgi:hypothetical protein
MSVVSSWSNTTSQASSSFFCSSTSGLTVVKTGLMGCDPLQLTFKPGVDSLAVGLEVPFSLHHCVKGVETKGSWPLVTEFVATVHLHW